ncbi:hypothetical protein MSWAN_0612 [Methanobacterium paludis]|uniref:Uncharacterized protein n=1 Tax=Methanobacterium paludis (strain DSM 25820 / JCM 18151 / SWAN1) TaxID=868131 RepID=F6D5N2_METPW|nr:hypothetical protein MSWAN_0612 [Methanobacterium paludis]
MDPKTINKLGFLFYALGSFIIILNVIFVFGHYIARWNLLPTSFLIVGIVLFFIGAAIYGQGA